MGKPRVATLSDADKARMQKEQDAAASAEVAKEKALAAAQNAKETAKLMIDKTSNVINSAQDAATRSRYMSWQDMKGKTSIWD